jgi:hypothetical protein
MNTSVSYIICMYVYGMSQMVHIFAVLAFTAYYLSDSSKTLYSLLQCLQRLNFGLNHWAQTQNVLKKLRTSAQLPLHLCVIMKS